VEALVGLLVLLLAAAPVVLVVLLVVAYIRSRRIGELLVRVERLERRLQLRHEARRPVVEIAEEVLPVESVVLQQPSPRPEPPPRPPEPPRPSSWFPEPLSDPPSEGAGIEKWIGNQLGWLAVVLFVFAVAFFLKYAFDNDWIGELGRVCIGLVIGAALCIAGLGFHRKGGKVLRDTCTAAGVATLYLSTYATFGFYSLLTREEGGAFLAVLMALAALLALAYDSPAVALLALVGGLLTPLLLASQQDQYVSLFVYLSCLAAAAVGLALLRPWPAVRMVALLGVQGLYWAWYAGNYHPEKQTSALVFLVAIFGLFLVSNLLTARRRRANGEDHALIVLNPFLFFIAAYRLLDADYHLWMGTLAVGVALVCAAGAALVARWREEDSLQRFLWAATGLAFLAAAVPLQVGAMEIGVVWVAPCWAALGLALWWFGLRIESRPYRVFGAILLVGAVFRLLTVEEFFVRQGPFVPVFNAYTTAGALTAAAVLGAAFAARRFAARLEEGDWAVRYGAGLTGVALVWLLLSREVYDFCTLVLVPGASFGSPQWPPPGERLAQTALSAAWTAYAALLLWIGFFLNHALTRWAALAVFAVTVAKVFLYDLNGLDGLFRILAFLILSVVLAAAAWGYQKFQMYFHLAPEKSPERLD
jgi:uncharacterized membrane protein